MEVPLAIPLAAVTVTAVARGQFRQGASWVEAPAEPRPWKTDRPARLGPRPPSSIQTPTVPQDSAVQPFSNLLARGLRRCLGPVVPPSLRLAFAYQIAWLEGCEPELTHLHDLGPNQGVAVDAGANEGLFTHRLARLYNHVHSFEINPALADRLQRMASANVSVYPVGLSRRAGNGILYTPYYRGRPLHGWAGLEPLNCSVAERYTESDVTVCPLDSFDLNDVSFLKIDVEGHELELLAGASQTIRRNRPVVLIEVNDRNRGGVQDYFRDMRYAEHGLDDLIGVPGSTGNRIYVPEPIG
ncbi:MAG: FkbM family methyltransferase [Isosphaeraceae bacterium]